MVIASPPAFPADVAISERSLTMRRLFITLFSLFITFGSWQNLYANEAMLQSLQETVTDLKRTVETLESSVHAQNEVIRQQAIQISALKDTGQAPQTSSLVMPAGAPPVAGVSGFNPEIGVVGTAQAKLTENSTDGEGNDTIALKELELNFAQVVDPYSRLDAVIAFNDNLETQNVDIEEAYYTRWGLPLGFIGQIGKFRAKVGKQNLLHMHQLDTVDYPLVIQDFFGEEGLASSGARLQNWIPNPWDIPVEVTGEVLRGNNGTSFSRISRRPIFNSHVKTFFEPTENSTFELGGTMMFGDENPRIFDEATGTFITEPKGQDRYGVHVVGADATLIMNLPEGRALKFQNEIYVQDRGSNSSIQATNINTVPWGFYSLIDLRLSKKFSAGVRLDYLEPLAVADFHGHTTMVSPYLTLWQSEFANFRLQYSRLDPASADAKSDNIIYLQANFLIGAHKHPVQ